MYFNVITHFRTLLLPCVSSVMSRSWKVHQPEPPAGIVILKSLHWLKANERIEYKLLSLTYKVLTSTQPT